jgi:putative hydrolase of the HAD superfamily
MQPLEAVLFDLFHTLINLGLGAPGTSTSEILGIAPERWAQQIFHHAPHHALGTVTDPVESIRLIAHAIDPTIPEERIRAAAASRPARFREGLLDVRPPVLRALGELRGLGLALGLISNAGLDEIGAWSESPLAPLFDAALFSCHEGVMKPDAEIYLRAARRLGVAPEACVYVGDGGSQEHEGARAVGMRTVLILGLLRETSPEAAARRARITDHEVDTFPELVALVRTLRG